jgi:hypothetical protein
MAMTVKHLYLITALPILACSPASSTSGTAPTPRRTSTFLAAEEILAANVDRGTVYDAISRLRPNWLTRGTTSYDPPTTEFAVVFVDGRRLGELESLRSIDANQIEDVRYYSAAEAGGRFGLQGGLSGVIEVSMKKR